MSRYAWIITHVNVKDLGEDMADEVGTIGPRGATDEQIAALQKGDGHVFRMLDDDGIWYYRGRIIFTIDGGPAQCEPYNGRFAEYVVKGGLDANPEGMDDEFGPLQDFGTPNAGATELQYRCKIKDEDGDIVKVWATI